MCIFSLVRTLFNFGLDNEKVQTRNPNADISDLANSIATRQRLSHECAVECSRQRIHF